jgi:hypothetical protein
MESSHILEYAQNLSPGSGPERSKRTLCGIENYQGASRDAALCAACERLAGWPKNQSPPPLPDKAPSPGALNAVASQAATEHGYLLAPVGTEVCRRTGGRDVEGVPAWEATALHHLLRNKFVTRGRLVLVKHGRVQRHMYEVEA